MNSLDTEFHRLLAKHLNGDIQEAINEIESIPPVGSLDGIATMALNIAARLRTLRGVLSVCEQIETDMMK